MMFSKNEGNKRGQSLVKAAAEHGKDKLGFALSAGRSFFTHMKEAEEIVTC